MYKDSFLDLERLTGVRWDIVDMARRLADSLRDHWYETEESDSDIYYLVGRRELSGIDRWQGVDGQPCLFDCAMRFDTEGQARDYMVAHKFPYTFIYRIDGIQSDIVYGFTYEISNAHDRYVAGRLCPWCNKNAAIKVTLKKTKARAKKIDAYVPCRSCSNAYDKEIDATDFMSRDSPMAAIQEMEGPPRFTQEDFAKVSRAAAKCGVFPTHTDYGKL